MSIRIALIGAGTMGADHARIIAEELSGAVLQAVCDAAEDRARNVADAFGAKHVFSDPKPVFARDDVDAVLIASPDQTHSSLVLACIAARKPVLCEKPLSQSPTECLQVMAAEAKAGRRLVQVGFMRRFDPAYAELRAAVADGVLGRALIMHNFHRNVATPAGDFTADMAITNSAPHEFDVTRFVLGSDFAAVSAFQPSSDGGRVGPVFMVLKTTDGQLVNIEINNNATYGYDVRAELVLEKGAVSLNVSSRTVRDQALRREVAYAADWRPRFAEAYRRQDKAFLRFIQTGKLSRIASDAWDGYCAATVAQAGVRALKEGRTVPVEMTAKPAFYDRSGGTDR